MRGSFDRLLTLCVGSCLGFLASVMFLGGKEMDWRLPSCAGITLLGVDVSSSSIRGSITANATLSRTTTLAVEMAKRVRIFCWISTHKRNHAMRAAHVKATWAPRCNNYVFISDRNDPRLPAIKLDVPEGRIHNWEKTKAAFTYVYQNYIEDYDWFMKVDDDTYLVVENLRFALMPLDPDQPLYYGSYVSGACYNCSDELYMQGGCYGLSRAALKVVVERGLNDSSKCPSGEGGSEDRGMGHCVRNLGIVLGDARELQGRHRFLPAPPEWLLGPEIPANKGWIKQCAFYPLMQGTECCGDYAISFHYTSVAMMYVLDYFIYRFRNPCGGREGGVAIPTEEVAQRLLETYALALGNLSPEDPFKNRVSHASMQRNELPSHMMLKGRRDD